MSLRLLGVVCVALAALPAFAQRRVSGAQMHERILAIVPIVGNGSLENPRRPMFAPLPSATSTADRTGIVGFHAAISDDGNSALVEFVAVHPVALAAVRAAANQPGVKLFQGSTATSAAQVQTEFQKYRKDFRFDRFILNVP